MNGVNGEIVVRVVVEENNILTVYLNNLHDLKRLTLSFYTDNISYDELDEENYEILENPIVIDLNNKIIYDNKGISSSFNINIINNNSDNICTN